MRDTSQRLQDIQDAITAIFKYTKLGRKAFDESELIQTWVIRHLEIIGEAARAIPQDFKSEHSEIAWRQINGMRTVIVHMYFGVDLDTVWEVVEKDLNVLQRSIQPFLQKNNAHESEP